MAYILLVPVCSIPFYFLFVIRSIRVRQKIPKGRLNSFNLSCTGLNTPSYTIYFYIIPVHSCSCCSLVEKSEWIHMFQFQIWGSKHGKVGSVCFWWICDFHLPYIMCFIWILIWYWFPGVLCKRWVNRLAISDIFYVFSDLCRTFSLCV